MPVIVMPVMLLLVDHSRSQKRRSRRKEEQAEFHGEQDAAHYEQRREYDPGGRSVHAEADGGRRHGDDRPRPNDEERVAADRDDDEDLRRQEERQACFQENRHTGFLPYDNTSLRRKTRYEVSVSPPLQSAKMPSPFRIGRQ